MNYLVVLSLAAFCANWLTSIDAWTSWIKCPENVTTGQECLDHFKLPMTDADVCTKTTSDGKFINITGCGLVVCYIKGKRYEPDEDLSKPYPDCCPDCALFELQLIAKANQNQSTPRSN